MKQIQPVLAPDLELIDTGADFLLKRREDEERICGKSFKGITIDDADFSHMIYSGARFMNCRFLNCSFELNEYTDVVFQSCDVSGANFNNAYFNRVTFNACKGVGTVFTGNRMAHVTFLDCMMNYANYDQSILKHLVFEHVELNSSSLSQCRCKQIEWKRAELKNASFFKTPLLGMDFTDSTISGLVLSDSNEELKGVTVDIYQAAELAKRLGIIIK